jgi:hypothetical protein
VGAAWGLTRRLLPANIEPPAPQDLLSKAESVAVPLVVGYSLIQLVIFVALTVSSAFISLPFPLGGLDWVGSVIALADLLNNQFTDLWRLIFYVLAVLAGIWQARRNQYALALLGVTQLGPNWVIPTAIYGVFWPITRHMWGSLPANCVSPNCI